MDNPEKLAALGTQDTSYYDVEHIFTRVLKSLQFQLIRVIIPNKN
jgi:hypothetical protein